MLCRVSPNGQSTTSVCGKWVSDPKGDSAILVAALISIAPGSPALLFLYRYIARFGFLDGVPGLIYCGFQAVQMFHTKAKIYELKTKTEVEE